MNIVPEMMTKLAKCDSFSGCILFYVKRVCIPFDLANMFSDAWFASHISLTDWFSVIKSPPELHYQL